MFAGEDDDNLSELSNSSYRSAVSSIRTRKSARSITSTLINNNNVVISASCSHQNQCHRHHHGHHTCYCLKAFYEDDELCRKNENGRLEFGIVSRYDSNYDSNDLKVFWTLKNEIQEQDLNCNRPELYHNLRLMDRKVDPGDIVYLGKKQGEVLDVSWQCCLRLMENGMGLLDIPCDRLEPLLPYFPGQKVEMNGWIGTVGFISTEATLLFSGGKTAIVDCSLLPKDQQPYPGRRVKYTLSEYSDAGLELLEGVPLASLFQQDPVEAFVMFVNVSSVQVNWNGRVISSTNPSSELAEMPPHTLTRSQLKKRVKTLGMPRDVDWDNCPEAVDRFYQYNVQPEDLVIPESGIEEYLVDKYFDHADDKKSKNKQLAKPLDKMTGSKIMTNVSYIVRVLRFSRVIRVKWCRSGKVDKVRASHISKKHSFCEPFRQIVQKKVSLRPYTTDEYGVTLSRDTNSMVSVQWLSKSGEGSSSFRMKHQQSEPEYDIEPHYLYGKIQPKEIVYRSEKCRLPEALFTVGWVRQVTLQGQMIVVSIHTKQEHSVFPPEIEATGMKINSDGIIANDSSCPRAFPMLKLHRLETLTNADQAFAINVQSHVDWHGEPPLNHFTLHPKAPKSHSFYDNKFPVRNEGKWMKAVVKDQLVLATTVNEEIGTIWIKAFHDRADLYCVLMAAPVGSPFEGALYTFDVQLIPEYPSSPPAVYLTTVLSPNGKSCKLRTGVHSLELSDVMMPPHNLLDSLIALQNKLFLSETESLELPSSAASLHRREAVKVKEDKLVNAQVMVDVLDLLFRLVMDPPQMWSLEVTQYFHITFPRTTRRLQALTNLRDPNSNSDEWLIPSFPLLPLSDGFSAAISNRLKRFEELMTRGLLLMDFNPPDME